MSGYPQQAGYPPPEGYPSPPQRRAGLMSRVSPFELAVAGFAVLCFIFAFMPWFGIDANGTTFSLNGWDFALGATAVALLVVAGILALLPLLESAQPGRKSASAVPAVLALVGAILMLTQISRGAGGLFDAVNGQLSRKWGLILVLVFGLLEAVAAVLGWLRASGRITLGQGTRSPYQQNWANPGYPPGYQQAQANYPQYGYPQGYQQPSAPQGYPPPGGYGPPGPQAYPPPGPQAYPPQGGPAAPPPPGPSGPPAESDPHHEPDDPAGHPPH